MENLYNDWGYFVLLCLLGAVLMLITAVGLWAWKRRKGSAAISDLPLCLLMVAAPFGIGLFHVWGSALCSLLLLGYLLYALILRGWLRFVWNEVLLMALLLLAGYALSSFWAVDTGLAPMGIVKFLPVPLFLLCLQQADGQGSRRVLRVIPYAGAAMVLLSAALLVLDSCRVWLLYRGRLGGFFEYPNTFALYLLCGLILAISEEKGIRRLVLAVILAGGIFAAGSRTVLVLAAAAGFLWALSRGTVRRRVALLLAVVLVILGGVGLALLLPDSPIGRILSISVKTNSFLCRLLYYRDALVQIVKHPFGLGYLGYYYSQGSFQTGSYHVMFAHNDLLQLLLDVGWVPGLTAAAVLLRQLLRKGQKHRLLLFVILGHAMLDFSLQYMAIWLVLAAVCDGGHVFGQSRLTGKAAAVSTCAALAALSVSFGASEFMESRGLQALVCYPNNTAALYEALLQAQDTQTMEHFADRILELDQNVSLAHSAKAAVAFQDGNVTTFLREKKQAIACAKYTAEEYRDYLEKLKYILGLYQQQQDEESAAYCKQRMLEIPELIRNAHNEVSALGWIITASPEITLTEEQTAYLQALQSK